MTKKREVHFADPRTKQAKLRRDYMAGTQPPYFGLLCDEVTLRCIAEGVVPSRLRLMAQDLLTDTENLFTKETTDAPV